VRSVEETLRIGDRLDQRFAQLRGEMARSKERSLVELARLLERAGTPYALIGGVAVQIWSTEPRTTIDVDVAVGSYDALPRDALRAAGFTGDERHEHSENWVGPDGTPVQFTDDPAFAEAIARAETHPLGGAVLRVAPVTEMIRAKLRAGRDPARRRSKRLMDVADATALAEQHPEATCSLTADERRELGL
jgi:hypothetical protein